MKPELQPVDLGSEGLFVAGLAHYPKPLDESIAQARASVSRVMSHPSPGIQISGGAAWWPKWIRTSARVLL